jgi:hypothetical protein
MRHRLAQAGLGKRPLFTDAAVDLIYTYSGGIPRLINTLADSSLRTGFALQADGITPFIVEEAAREMELARFTAAPRIPEEDNEVVACLDAKLEEKAMASSSNAADGIPIERMPLESYSNRQKSLGFFAQWMGRR